MLKPTALVTYLINKSFILVHREHGALPVRSGAGCPLTPLVLAAMVRQEAKAQGPSSTPNSEEAPVMWEPKKKEERRLLCWAISPALSSSQPHSSATLPMLEHRSSLTDTESPTKQNMKTKAGSSAQPLLCVSLWLRRLSSRAASNFSDKRPSANPPERLTLWHHWCRAVHSSAPLSLRAVCSVT